MKPSAALLMRLGLWLQLMEGWTELAVAAEKFAASSNDTARAAIWLEEHGFVQLGERRGVARWLPHRDFCELWAEHFTRPCPITTTSRTPTGSPLMEVDRMVGN